MITQGMVAEAAVQTEGAKFTLRYYVEEKGLDTTVYGLRIEKYAGGRLLESETTPALFERRDQAEALAARFARGTVTPITLLQMADESMSTGLPTRVQPAGQDNAAGGGF